MERIESIDDPRVAPYRNLRDRTLRGESIFVAEGRVLTRRLLESRYPAQSVFVSEHFADEFQGVVGGRAPLYVAPESLLLEVVGFKFHRGVLGVGCRSKLPSLDELTAPLDAAATWSLVVCPEITKPENLGLIFRSAGAFGVDAVLLGERCCDPFSRRCLRVSIGAVLQVPFTKSTDLLADLRRLKDRWGVELMATVLDKQAERLADVRWPSRIGILFGNEADGLRQQWLALCGRHVTIPMSPAADSLNLGVAAGIFVYEMKKATKGLDRPL